jgi:sigma-B regulation protein RsbU (phosphoserine phosphatase)
VGGDYYDFLEQGEGNIAIALADVAGKGISAALLMSAVQASLRTLSKATKISPAALTAAVNDLLEKTTGPDAYATFFYAQFDPKTKSLIYVNAGHNPPMLMHKGDSQIHPLEGGGPILGMFPDCEFEQKTVRLETGDLLVAYTDGVTEALNSQEEEYGKQRLAALLVTARELTAAELANRIALSVREWVGSAAQSDDLTLIVLKVK